MIWIGSAIGLALAGWLGVHLLTNQYPIEWLSQGKATIHVVERPGPAHCNDENLIFLGWYAEGGVPEQYVDDPEDNFRFDPTRVRATAAINVPVPAAATFSGFRDGDRELWFTPERDAAYIVRDGRADRWPRLNPPAICI